MMARIFGLSDFYINFVKTEKDMKKIWAIIIVGLFCLSAGAQLPKGYEAKTKKTSRLMSAGFIC